MAVRAMTTIKGDEHERAAENLFFSKMEHDQLKSLLEKKKKAQDAAEADATKEKDRDVAKLKEIVPDLDAAAVEKLREWKHDH